ACASVDFLLVVLICVESRGGLMLVTVLGCSRDALSVGGELKRQTHCLPLPRVQPTKRRHNDL
ncbi:hypothetical protein A2U01_0104729, partial [Trifolium medium]|nr:hypothetical protein [Trifolium medium]